MPLNKPKRKLALFVAALASFASSLYSVTHLDDRASYEKAMKGLTPLSSPLTKSRDGKYSFEFRPMYSEPHYISLVFPTKPNDQTTNVMIQRRQDFRRSSNETLPGPDFTWQVTKSGRRIASGGGAAGPIACAGNAIAFGEVHLAAFKPYVLEINVGSDFQRLFESNPRIEVGVSRVAVEVGLAWGHAFHRPIMLAFAWISAIFGLLFSIFCLRIRSHEQ